jgi:hypothetical protein
MPPSARTQHVVLYSSCYARSGFITCRYKVWSWDPSKVLARLHPLLTAVDNRPTINQQANALSRLYTPRFRPDTFPQSCPPKNSENTSFKYASFPPLSRPPTPWVNATLTILWRYIARVRRGGPQDGSRKPRAPVSRRRAQRSHLTDGSGSRGTERWREPECSIADDNAEHQHARVQIRQQQQRGDSSGQRRRGK